MKEYPQEIVKAAEELIEEHLSIQVPVNACAGDEELVGIATELFRSKAIRAAIVSCKFADDMNNGPSETSVEDRMRTYQIKSYLEELL